MTDTQPVPEAIPWGIRQIQELKTLVESGRTEGFVAEGFSESGDGEIEETRIESSEELAKLSLFETGKDGSRSPYQLPEAAFVVLLSEHKKRVDAWEHKKITWIVDPVLNQIRRMENMLSDDASKNPADKSRQVYAPLGPKENEVLGLRLLVVHRSAGK